MKMTTNINVGSTFLHDRRPLLAEFFGVESERYAKNWSLVTALDGFSLGVRIRAEGWHLFFSATQIKAIAFGGMGSAYVQGAMTRMLKKVARENFNCMEVTQIKAKHFCGVPYLSIVAHSRHVQRDGNLQTQGPATNQPSTR